MAIQETTTSTSELFLNTCASSVYSKDRNLHGGRVMMMFHKGMEHLPIAESDNNPMSVWVKVFVNKTSHFIASWYPQPNGTG